jgi:aspartate/tyrosine/aromatic aminotransferase
MTRQSGQSAFADLAVAPPDAVFLVSAKFREDASPKKVNMGVGGMHRKCFLHLGSYTVSTV